VALLKGVNGFVFARSGRADSKSIGLVRLVSQLSGGELITLTRRPILF
jgi:hypothetical protein